MPAGILSSAADFYLKMRFPGEGTSSWRFLPPDPIPQELLKQCGSRWSPQRRPAHQNFGRG